VRGTTICERARKLADGSIELARRLPTVDAERIDAAMRDLTVFCV